MGRMTSQDTVGYRGRRQGYVEGLGLVGMVATSSGYLYVLRSFLELGMMGLYL